MCSLCRKRVECSEEETGCGVRAESVGHSDMHSDPIISEYLSTAVSQLYPTVENR